MSNEESTIPSSPIKLKKTVSKVRRPRYQTPAPGAYYPERVRLDHNPSALILGKLERSGIYEETHNKKFIPGPGNYQDSGSQALKLKKNLGTIVFTNTSKASQEKVCVLFTFFFSSSVSFSLSPFSSSFSDPNMLYQ